MGLQKLKFMLTNLFLISFLVYFVSVFLYGTNQRSETIAMTKVWESGEGSKSSLSALYLARYLRPWQTLGP